MNKQEIFEKIQKLKGTKTEELEGKYQEFFSEFKEMGIPEEHLERKTLFRLTTFYTRRSSAAIYTGVVLGVSNPTDFGAKKFYDAIIKMWQEGDESIRQLMVDKNQITLEGEPLWHNSEFHRVPEWRYKDDEGNLLSLDRRIIKPEQELRANALALLKKKGTDSEYSPALINIIAEGNDKEIPKFQTIEVPLSGNRTNDQGYKLLYFRKGEFEIAGEALSYDNACELADEYFQDITIDSEEELATWALENQSSRAVIIKRTMIETAEPIIGEGKVGALRIGSLESIFENVESDVPGFGGYTVFTPAGFNEYSDGTSDVFLVARPQVQEDNIVLSYMGSIPKFKTEKVDLEEASDDSYEVDEHGDAEEETARLTAEFQ